VESFVSAQMDKRFRRPLRIGGPEAPARKASASSVNCSGFTPANVAARPLCESACNQINLLGCQARPLTIDGRNRGTGTPKFSPIGSPSRRAASDTPDTRAPSVSEATQCPKYHSIARKTHKI
jgi:hypothetical protein